jgi:hypothetical protein
MLRTAVLFAAGFAGLAYETLATGTERPTLLILFGAMMGLPLFLQGGGWPQIRDRLFPERSED